MKIYGYIKEELDLDDKIWVPKIDTIRLFELKYRRDACYDEASKNLEYFERYTKFDEQLIYWGKNPPKKSTTF